MISNNHENAESIAQQSGFTKQLVDTGPFVITTYHRLSPDKTDKLTVYIEGDGYAFVRKNRLSSDPTPQNPVALELAVHDPGPSVLYIARPCQYLPCDLLKNCDPKFWSTHRYAEEVVSAINSVIDQIPAYEKIRLVGYSGGGSIAVLIAARRQDIDWLITIGANLDHIFWTNLHNITPLSGSLNPADYATSIQNISQLHLSGEKDKTVPASVLHSYLEKTANHKNIHVKIIPGFDHQCCWVDIWPRPLCQTDISYCLE